MAVALTPGCSSAPPGDDVPRSIVVRASTGDRIFRGILRGGGLFVLFITGMILLFLFLRSLGAFERAGFGFFTTASFAPERSDHLGIAALLPDSALIAVMALAMAITVGVSAAIFISEYAPPALRGPMIAG